jgi:DNA-binding NarL/FixJ family response regulator
MTARRVLLADDHPMFRAGLRALLTSTPDMDVVGEASTGAEAITQARALGPDIVVMDLHIPDLNGVEATRQLLAIAPGTAVLVLSMFDDDDSVFAAMRAGARGYERLLAYLTRPLSAYDQQLFPELTTREREILDLMAAGRPYGDIARQLFISPKTVRNNISSIFTKLQVADGRMQLSGPAAPVSEAVIPSAAAGDIRTVNFHGGDVGDPHQMV